MLRIAMVEDSDSDALRLRSLLDRYLGEEGISACLESFKDGESLLANYDRDYDLVILDIDLPGQNGLAIAARLRQLDENLVICFMTALGQLAAQGYSVAASGFMIKPLTFSSLRQNMQMAQKRIKQRQSQLISVHQGRSSIYMDIQRIFYIEASRKKTILHTVDGPLTVSESIKALQSRLNPQHFFRIHAAFLVNLSFVQNVGAADVLINETWLPLSKHRKREFMRALAQFVGRVS